MHARMMLAAAFILFGAGGAWTEEITVATLADPTLDPHFVYLGSNVAVWRHFFTTLTMHDDDGNIIPSLAQSWNAPDDHTWVFHLRPDAKFKDGAPVTADDVVFSLGRVGSVQGNPAPYTPAMQAIKGFEADDPATVRVHTAVPAPDVPANLMEIAIVSRSAVTGKSTSDFNSLQAMRENGPFTVVSFAQGDRLVLRANPNYWGEKSDWQQATIRFVKNDAARVSALLAGDVDLIDTVPPNDVPKLRTNPKIAVQDGPSTRLLIVTINVRRDPIPTMTDADGKPMATNPLTDVRVRQAVSKAFDRAALVDKIMDGEAIATSQYSVQGLVGFDPGLPVEKYDPQGARELLATAGYPRGFGLSINCSNNRYPNDEKICQALGQMLSRIGLQAKVETMPVAMLTPLLRGTPDEPSKVALGLNGIGAISNLPPIPGFVIHSINATVGRGGSNYGRFSDPALDRAIDEAIATLDPQQRDQRLRDAMAAARQQVPVIPLYFQKVTTASRADLAFHTNPFEETLVWHIHKRQ